MIIKLKESLFSREAVFHWEEESPGFINTETQEVT